jgi:hypothetical protein
MAMTATPVSSTRLPRPASEAFRILHIGYVLAPLVAGVDKFFNILTDWEKYLSPTVSDTLGLEPSTIMMIVGGVEIAAALLVLARPSIGGYVVAAWLAVVIVNLIMIGDFYDIAFRDFGLLLGALALARLATAARSER